MTPKIDEKNRQHSPTLEKALCRAPFLAYGILWRSPCHPAAAEGAKLSKCAAAGLNPALTACQTSHNVVPTSCQRSAQKKSNAELNAQLIFFFSGSALHTLTPCLKG